MAGNLSGNMVSSQLLCQATRAATALLQLKMRQLPTSLRGVIAREVHVRQFERVEQDLKRSLVPVFRRIISTTKKRLAELGDTRSHQDTADNLLDQVFDPKEWKRLLIDTAFPVLAEAMSDAAMAQLRMLGIEPEKATTASEWLEFSGDELPPGISTELPAWMIDAIEVQLQTTFAQPYWDNIIANTGSDINQFLVDGLTEGWSISRMAGEISNRFPMAYNRQRAEAVARTESANALNGARRLSMDNLQEELGEEVPLKIVWISVLGNTTRPDHAALHNVEADEKGMFNLGGQDIPWPGHWSLEASQRINCQCTLISELGE